MLFPVLHHPAPGTNSIDEVCRWPVLPSGTVVVCPTALDRAPSTSIAAHGLDQVRRWLAARPSLRRAAEPL